MASPFSRRKHLHDRKVARSAGSSGKLPDLPAAVAQIRGRSTSIGRGARPRSGVMPGSGQGPMPIRAASLAAAVRDDTLILDSTAET